METIIHCFVLIGLGATAIAAMLFRDLLAAVVSLGAFSLLLALEFYILQAPDVAIAEAGIGAGLTTAIFVIAIRGTRRREDIDE